MTRHGKNATASCVYSYHEKKKDAQQSGYGSKKLRLGKDSIKEFDCCCLTLQPCKNPVITQDGYLFDKEAILEYIIHQKKEIGRKLKEFEKQKQKFEKDKVSQSQAEQKEKLEKFVQKGSLSAQSGAGSSGASGSKDKDLPSFWIPSLTPQAKEAELKKPDEKVRCPMSDKPIRLKDLIDIHFTEIKDGDNKALIAKQARFVCPVTNDVLGNSVPCAALRTSGHVVTMECVEKLIKKDMLDPMNGKKMTDKDIIPLQRGATGFAGAGLQMEAKKEGAAMPSA